MHILLVASTCSSLLLPWAPLTGLLAVSMQAVAVRVLVVAVLLETCTARVKTVAVPGWALVLQRGFHYRSFHY